MYKKHISIAVLDDHPMVLQGIEQIVVGNLSDARVSSFSTIATFETFMVSHSIDLLLVDMFLPDGSGLEVCKNIKENYPDVQVLGMSSSLEKSTIVELLQLGGSGFILKNTPATEVLEAIKKVMQGEIVLSPEANTLLLRSITNPTQLPALTRREKELLKYLAQGKTTAEIAEHLFLSRFTIDTYRKNLLQKFNVRNTIELLALVTKENLL
jgi:DNA-binding NarL/FixJ family response regulator